MKSVFHIIYHIAIIVLSASIALSLPYSVAFITDNFLAFWSMVENEKIFLVTIEIACAVLLIFLINFFAKNLRGRKLASAAKQAELILAFSRKGLIGQKKSKHLKQRNGVSRDIMLIGSTGFRTFAEPKTDLHEVIKNCRQAKIMLLNPFSKGASQRAASVPHPDITSDQFKKQIEISIDFLKKVNEIHQNVRLKFYNDAPFLKLAILGDYIWMQHYHTGADVKAMPEYVFKNSSSNSNGLFAFFYQYFLKRWHDPELKECDFSATDSLKEVKAVAEGKNEAG